MNNVKRRIVRLIMICVVVISLALSVAFQIIIEQYILKEVDKTFARQTDYYMLQTGQLETVLGSQNNLFSTTDISIATNYIGQDNIINRCIQFKEELLEGTIIRIDEGELELYAKCVSRDQSGFTVSIINVSTVSNLTTLVNWSVLVILGLAGIIFSLIGIKVGTKLEDTQNKLKKFFANTTHELKTPLMSIQGYAEAIQQELIDPMIATEIITKKSDEMNSLINKILELSKLDSGEVRRGQEEIDLQHMLYQILEDLMLEEPFISLEFTEPKNDIRGEEIQLYQLFSNVLSNAKRYAKDRIAIRVKQDRLNYHILIYNDGQHIVDKDLPYVMERFYKGEDGNTGIGLAIAAEFAKLYGGNITIKNVEQGVQVQIILAKI